MDEVLEALAFLVAAFADFVGWLVPNLFVAAVALGFVALVVGGIWGVIVTVWSVIRSDSLSE